MGGILILLTVTISSLLWCDPENNLYWLVLGSMLFLGLVGFADDYEKVAKKNSKGIRGWYKLAAQLLLAIFVFLYLRYNADYPGAANSPLHSLFEDAGWWSTWACSRSSFSRWSSWALPTR